MVIGTIVGVVSIFVVGGIIASSLRVVRPIEVGLIERFGKYIRTGTQGLNFVIPLVDHMTRVNMTERMVDVEPQMVITQDKLNAEVDAVVYYKIKDPKASQYNVNNHKRQLTSLARTTLRAVIGKMTLTQANEERDKINEKVETILDKETDSYGVEVLRVEIQKIQPPSDVQESMNKVVKAEQEKIAALDMAKAVETKADGVKKAAIKEAEGIKESLILEATGRAESIKKVASANAEKIKVINSSIRLHFKDKAIDYKKLETAQEALKNGTKYVIDSKSNIMNVMSEAAGVPIPIARGNK